MALRATTNKSGYFQSRLIRSELLETTLSPEGRSAEPIPRARSKGRLGP